MPAKKRKRKTPHEKPLFCDPGMCDSCQYIGEGDFICACRDDGPVLVVEDWQSTPASKNCPKRRRNNNTNGGMNDAENGKSNPR